ncbi:MAG TPA: 50S ribosomal protein L11 methyltransferase [Rhizomicrobium sp.]
MNTPTPLDALVESAAENPIALIRLAGILRDKGEEARACDVAIRALRAAPDDAEIRSLAANVLSPGVPHWHFQIVRDAARNAAYEAALRRHVTPQTAVLEIGTGTAILAMMAARAGAKKVVTCEMTPAIAAAAREIVAVNGYAGRISVVAKNSIDLSVEDDLGGRADLLVSEIVSNTIVGEDALPVTEHAARALLKPGARIVPARGIVRVALAHDALIHRRRMDTVDGFDLSIFNRLAANSYEVKCGDPRLALLSAPADLFDFDFQSGGPFPAAAASVTLTAAAGTANGVAQWIALQMDAEGWYENKPSPGALSAWAVIFWPFAAPRPLAAGAAVDVFGRHDRHALRIWG